jgi:hypothetical protein
MKRSIRLVVIASPIFASLIVPRAPRASDVLHPSAQSEFGPTPLPLVLEPALGDPEVEKAELASGGSRDGTILWHRHFEDPIYTSTGVSRTTALVLAGTYLNPPQQVEATPLSGDGTPDWTSPGTEFFVDASRGGSVLAAVDFTTQDSTAVISQWGPGSARPLWSYRVHPCRSMVYQGWASRKPIQVSDDGSTIAVALVMWTQEGQRGRLHVFDAGNGTPVVEYDLPTGNVVATAISSSGDYVAMAGWPNIYVYDRSGLSLRWSGPIGSGNDALAISGDGRYVAWGWTTFHLREWTGVSYTPLWTHTPGGGTYVGQCALDTAGNTLAVSWDNGNVTPNEISLDLYELPSLNRLWRYEYLGTPASTHVDIASQMDFSPDGQRLAVGSWGGSFPEIHVFARTDSIPLYTLDTPGSIFDVDIVSTPDGGSHVSACGKGVHAGQSGRGGDLYAIEIPGDATGVEPRPRGPDAVALQTGHPNPFRADTEIRFTLENPGPVRLTVYDARGRLVQDLVNGLVDAGEQVITWRGRNAAGDPVASGIYFYRLETESAVKSRKVLVLR